MKTPSMTRFLLFAPSLGRIAGALEKHAGGLEILLMDRAGKITCGGAPVAAEDARPQIVWGTGELYQQPAAPAFFAAALGSPDLAWVQSEAAGFDNPVFARVVAKGARLTTSHGQAVGMADYVVAGVLDAFQRGAERRAAQAAHAWTAINFREVRGTTWMIVGFGAVGRGVAERARAFGACILGVRRSPGPDAEADEILTLEAARARIGEADVVALCCPLSADTRHFADAALFAAMKAGCVIANVGRGGLIDEAALLAALESGVPAHAVLDVFEKEPLPADSPLWDHPRVSLTAHNSGVTGAQSGRNTALFLDNLDRFLAGRPLLNEVAADDVLARRG
jgi:phosphoglycerate dehydrogenase-like enzyme